MYVWGRQRGKRDFCSFVPHSLGLVLVQTGPSSPATVQMPGTCLTALCEILCKHTLTLWISDCNTLREWPCLCCTSHMWVCNHNSKFHWKEVIDLKAFELLRVVFPLLFYFFFSSNICQFIVSVVSLKSKLEWTLKELWTKPLRTDISPECVPGFLIYRIQETSWGYHSCNCLDSSSKHAHCH